MSEPEKMLYDEPDPSVDATQAADAVDFDFGEWLQGVRPTRRAVKVYARADLVAQMEEVAGGYRDDLPAAQKRKIRDEVIALRDEFEASGRWFVTEARSAEWQEKFRKDTAKRLGVDLALLDGPTDDLTPEQAEARTAAQRAMTLEQVAAQTVTPSGVTPQGLAKLEDVAPTELAKIIAAATFANRQSAGSAGVLTRDFSPAHSGKSGTAGSKRR